MRYDIYIPRGEGKKLKWVRLLIEAGSWTEALKSGLLRLGEDGRSVDSAICTVRADGTIFVRDASHGRTFMLREVAADPAQPGTPRQSPPAGRMGPDELRTMTPAPAAFGNTQPGKVVEEKRDATPPEALQQPLRSAASGPLKPELLAKLKAELDGVHRFGGDMQSAAGYVLDLALRWIPSESGSVLYTHLNQRDLYFAAARGPKAKEVLAFRVPLGRGIVGFCVSEGTSLGVSDVQRDPRFFARISQSIGHEVQTILAAPILTKGLVYGALELINRAGPSAYDARDAELLSFMGYQLAEYINRIIPG